MSFPIALRIAYQGTRFEGWARQPGRPTVQGTVEAALQRLLGRFAPDGGVRLRGASRTDAGVHALDQVASVDLPVPAAPEPDQLARGLASLLPPDIRPRAVGMAPPGFDPRRAAASKTYRYAMAPGGTGSPFLAPFVTPVAKSLDVGRMADAAARLVGRIDMAGFSAGVEGVSPAPRTVSRAALWEAEEGVLLFEVEADAFLRHAVRRMVGTLLWAGRRRLAPADVEEIARAGDPSRAGPTAPPQGLFLWRVHYPEAVGLRLAAAEPRSLLGFPGV